MHPIRELFSSPFLLLVAFGAVHAVLGTIGLAPNTGWPFGDVTSVYREWSLQALRTGQIPGIDIPWVYPVVALVPMLVPWLMHGVDYTVGWLIQVFVLNLAALLVFTRGGQDARRVRISWFWVAYLVVLGPVSIGRIDSICVPLVIIAFSVWRKHPLVAGLLLGAGAWIKIWPAAVGLVRFVVGRSRGWFAVGVAAVCAVVIGGVALLGGTAHLFGFVTGQTSRALQIESVGATPWLWQALTGGGVTVVYNDQIYTNEIHAAGAYRMAALVTWLMAIVLVLLVVLLIVAVRRGAPRSEVAVYGTFALVTSLIVFNKVGSPQFEVWLVAPVLMGLAVLGRRMRTGLVMVLMLGGLTQVIYPYLYGYLLSLDPWMLVVITLRNGLLVGLFGWAVYHIVRLTVVPRSAARIDRFAA